MEFPENWPEEAKQAYLNFEHIRIMWSVDVEFLTVEAERLFALAKALSDKVQENWENRALVMSEKWQDQASRYSSMGTECTRLATMKVKYVQDMWKVVHNELRVHGIVLPDIKTDDIMSDEWPEFLADISEGPDES